MKVLKDRRTIMMIIAGSAMLFATGCNVVMDTARGAAAGAVKDIDGMKAKMAE